MGVSTELLENRLKQTHHSITIPRLVVFKTLAKQEAISISELIACLPAIDRASVYRTVNLFIQLGVIDRVQIGWKYKLELSAQYSHHHHHLTCTNCGTVIPFPENNQIETLLDHIAQKNSFEPSAHQIEIRGLCKSCRSNLGSGKA